MVAWSRRRTVAIQCGGIFSGFAMTAKAHERQPAVCPVCLKRTEEECSHIDCPNRKRMTAMPPQGGNVRYLVHGVMRVPTCKD